jgi:hypothetical protein
MDTNKKKGFPWSTIIIVVIIYVLFMAWSNQRNENERANSEFAIQTARAESQRSVSISATQEMENRVKDCININLASRYSGTYQCIVGQIANVKAATNIDSSNSSEPPFEYAYFSYMPNEFYLGGMELVYYSGNCVKVTGKIIVDANGTPAMIVSDDFGQGRNIEILPADVCKYH